ncbi:hypothetical protein EVAR_63770_1 [Eumeta japonica]|uniref:Mos1 transposase HTH domain-containing protein n=1 Tax=Eumeta variegata TaxID=151549 RepID=A0A4C1ZT68_EUMVA|nr:hypothetical protein EVAR_63770_1 [Eumeta japonica]
MSESNVEIRYILKFCYKGQNTMQAAEKIGPNAGSVRLAQDQFKHFQCVRRQAEAPGPRRPPATVRRGAAGPDPFDLINKLTRQGPLRLIIFVLGTRWHCDTVEDPERLNCSRKETLGDFSWTIFFVSLFGIVPGLAP